METELIAIPSALLESLQSLVHSLHRERYNLDPYYRDWVARLHAQLLDAVGDPTLEEGSR